MEILDIKAHLKDENILAILAESTYMSTEEKLNARAEKYMNDDRIVVWGANVADKFHGIIILSCKENDNIEILDIAVLKESQKQGIGHRMIKCIKESYKPISILAETDDDAVDFYRKIGFKVQSLGERYPGIIRYECKWECDDRSYPKIE